MFFAIAKRMCDGWASPSARSCSDTFAVAAADCTLTKELAFPHAEIGTMQVFRDAGSSAIAFASQMQVKNKGVAS